MTLEICTGEEENQIQKSRHHEDPNKTSEISLSMSSPSDQPSQNGGVSPIPMIPGPRIRSHGSVSVIGRRKEMEDSLRVRLGFVETRGGYDFFGVYDGHGGGQVSKMCGERFHGLVAAAVESGGGAIDWEDVMLESFRRMDCEVTGVQAVRTVGSAVVVVVVGEEVVVVANCGDCRAVLCRGGVAIALSDDHKPDRPDELRRVEAAGGKVINWNGHRVVGVLSTSRSIGDEYLKPFVTSEPEVRVTDRTSADEFLILASDGLWDVVSNEFACQVVRRCLRGRMRRKQLEGIEADVNRAGEAAAVLVELAMARGSSDNISVIVVELNRRSKIS